MGVKGKSNKRVVNSKAVSLEITVIAGCLLVASFLSLILKSCGRARCLMMHEIVLLLDNPFF